MFLCLFLHDLLVWVPRSMFWTRGMKSQIFVTSYDLAFIFLMIMFITFFMFFKGNPRFSRLCFWMRPSGPHLSKEVWNLVRDLVGTQFVFVRREQWLNSQHVLLCYWLGSGENVGIICMHIKLVLRMWLPCDCRSLIFALSLHPRKIYVSGISNKAMLYCFDKSCFALFWRKYLLSMNE